MTSVPETFVPPYHEVSPPARLRGYVACVWQSHSLDQPRKTTILPDGCVDLIWQTGRAPFVAGPMTKPVLTSASVAGSSVGIRLQPGVAAAVLGVPAVELRDSDAPLADLLPRGLRDPALERAIATTEGVSVTFALDAVCALLRRAKPPDPFVIDASRWFAQHPGRPAALFIADSGVSERHARRRFHEHVGYGAKTLQRILRMQRVLWLLSRPGPPLPLSQLAIAAGYADQAHLTRELRALTGQLPTALAANDPRSAVADLFKTPLP
jgi:AraC-like DNA-binding protein